MKKIISLLLSALMVGSAVTSLPLSAGAASVEQGAVDTVGTPIVSDGFHIVWNGGNSSKIIKYTGNAVNLTIPHTIEGYEINAIDSQAFSGNDTLNSVVIPSGIEEIGYKAFSQCSALKSVVIESRVNTLDEGIFYGCENLESVTLPNGTTEITDNMFRDCNSLISINLPKTLEKIGYGAFSGCDNLETITGGSMVEYIGDSAFSGTKWDENVSTTRGKATYIGKCFYKYVPTESQLNGYNLTIKNGTKYICSYPFADFFALNAICIPSSVEKIVSYAFDGYYSPINLTDVYYMGTEEQWDQIDIETNNSYLYNSAIHYDYGHSVIMPKITVFTNGNKGITVKWNAVNGASKYKLFRKTSGNGSWVPITTTGDTSYTDYSVIPGETYFYSVRCVSSVFEVYVSTYYDKGWQQTYIAAPVLKPLTNSLNGVNVSWEASAGAVNYRVYRKNSAGAWVKTGETADTSFVDKNVESGKTYTYTVKCISADGSKSESGFDHKGKTIQFIAAPVLKPLTNALTGVSVSWEASAGAANYRVYRKNKAGTFVSIGETTSTDFVDTDAKSGNTYTYTVKGINNDGISSGYDHNGQAIRYISAPVISKLSNTTEGVKIEWNPPPCAGTYRICRLNDEGNWIDVGTATNISFVDTNVESGKIYTYTVKCTNKDGEIISSFYPGKKIKFIAAPVIYSLTKNSSGITVKWNKPAGSTNNYKVFRRANNGIFSSIGNVTTTSFTDTTVQTGNTYYYTVRVLSADGKTNLSGYISSDYIKY